jgi:hypothetical protein
MLLALFIIIPISLKPHFYLINLINYRNVIKGFLKSLNNQINPP